MEILNTGDISLDMTIWDSFTITGICVLVVFVMLILLALVVAAFKMFSGKKEEVQEEQALEVPYVAPSTLKLEDIKDEDMMVAALVATIDYHEETKKDVRVVSIKQIG